MANLGNFGGGGGEAEYFFSGPKCPPRLLGSNAFFGGVWGIIYGQLLVCLEAFWLPFGSCNQRLMVQVEVVK